MLNIIKILIALRIAFIVCTTNAILSVKDVMAAFGIEKVDDGLKGTEKDLDLAIQGYVVGLLSFLFVIAVVVGIWGGFHILTAAGDEEKVKKGKTIILFSLLGIIIIFLAGPIVELLFNYILK